MKQLNKWQWSTLILSAILVMAFSVFIYRYEPFKSGFEITDQLGGNIFPATILSTATTDASLIVPADSDYIGNPKSCIAIRLKNSYANSKLRIEVAETPFFSQSVSEFILPKAGKEYNQIYVCLRQFVHKFSIFQNHKQGLRQSERRTAHTNGRYLLLFTSRNDAVQHVFGLHLHDLSTQFGHQLEMIQQMPLVRKGNAVGTLPGSLYIKGNERRIITGCQSCRLADNAAWRFLMTADTRHELLMPHAHTGNHHFILHFLLHS